jgi:Domain of unknown function (DUF4192)
MSPQDLPALRVQSPADVLAIVPYLLGFHPSDDLVVLALSGTRLVVTARADLPAAGTPPAQARAAASHLAAVSAAAAEAAVVVAYGPPAPAAAAIDAAVAELAARGVSVPEAIRVSDGRWRSHLCRDTRCCPPGGFAHDPAGSPIAAQAVLAGLAALPDRAAVAAQIQPLTGAARQSMRQATELARGRLKRLLGSPAGEEDAGARRAGEQAVRAAFDRARRGGQLAEDEAAWLTVVLTCVPVRDYAWTRTGGADWHVRLWADLTRRAQPDLLAAPAALLAFAAWQGGQGALANIAVDRALQADPDYSMGQLLAKALAAGMPPWALGCDWPPRPDELQAGS